MFLRKSTLFVPLAAAVALAVWLPSVEPIPASGISRGGAGPTERPISLSITDPEDVEGEGWKLFSEIADLRKGEIVELPLTGGKSVRGLLNYVRVLENGAALAGGILAEGDGIFEIAHEPGSYRGFILPKKGKVAFVYSGSSDGAPRVARRSRGEVICEPGPLPEALADAGPHPAEAAIYNGGSSVGIIHEAIPILHSLPRAAATIYLDFDGEVIEGQAWEGGARIVAPAYNLPAGEIIDMWRRVAEDFAPFEVNVTTDLQAYRRAPQGLRIRCVTTTNNFAGAGGVAFNDTFRQSGDPVCWNFYRGAAGAVVISHEVGHTFGLHHDDTSTQGYYGGHGSGAMSWGPIMGAPYNQNICQWSKGDYPDAAQRQDDLIQIGSSVERRADDHSPWIEQATPLVIGAGGSVSGAGVIGSPDDLDRFVFTTGGGVVDLRFDVAAESPNLDIEARLYDHAGVLIAVSSPENQLWASITQAVGAGTYTVTVDGVGNGSWSSGGYDDYGSLGEYRISGHVPAAGWMFRVPVHSLPGTAVGTVATSGSGYAIVEGNAGGAFSIHPSSGLLQVANPGALPDFPVFHLTVIHSGGSVPVEIRIAPTMGVKREIWTGVAGDWFAGMDGPPALVLQAGTLQGAFPAEHYTQRFTGYLVPSETGNHVFWTAADDISELWLSTDDNPANRVRIAFNHWNTGVNWENQPSQRSVGIHLVAGRRYFLEFLHREYTGGDHAAVAWETPTKARALIPMEHLEYPGAPPNRAPWLTNRTFRVREDSVPGTIVGNLLAGDFEPGSVLSDFTIIGGNVGEAFTMNPGSGVLSVNGTLSFAARPVYDLEVRVTDSGGLQTTARIAVEVEARAVRREFWAGIGGNPVSDLTSNPRFPDDPTSVGYVNFFEIPPDSADQYGQRLSGYLRAPVSGIYTFWISSDDGGELWLSSDSDPTNRSLVAGHNGATGFREWERFPSQRSGPIFLEAGRFYYIEAFHKEGVGGDHVSVAWEGPGFGRVILGAPHVTQEFYNHGAPVLDDRWVTVSDRDGFVASLEARDWADPGTSITYAIIGGNDDGAFMIDPSTGTIRSAGEKLPLGVRTLTVTAADNGPVPRSDSAAVTVTVLRAALKRELWTGLGGGQGIEELTGWLGYPHAPDATESALDFDSPVNRAEHYGQRVSGFLLPPATGDYVFWIASDDSGELWLSSDENPANRRWIAGVIGAVGHHEWTQQGNQQSAVIHLVAGQRYYIEALHKEGVGGDHLAVAWQGPGFGRTVIGNAHLEYPEMLRPALRREVWQGNETLVPPPSPPGFTGTLSRFKGPTDVSDHYSERISGFIVPRLSGNYAFWLASDDHGELRISTDESEDNLSLIASVSGWVGEEEWDAQPSQKSAPRFLVAGRRYRVEVLHRDGVGGDHVAVAWEGPGFSRRIIPNECLEHPEAPDDRSLLRLERWLGVLGDHVPDLLDHSAFPDSPTTVGTLPPGAGLIAPGDIADDYGQRVSGYLVPPEHGRYTFWLASDNSSELWLSTDENPANRVLISRVDDVVPPESWDIQPGQKSLPVALEAGRRYYLEILHKEGFGGDHLAVSWEGPGFGRQRISNAHLEHPLSLPGNPSILREVWTGIGGEDLTELTTNGSFLAGLPSGRGRLTAFEVPPDYGDHYGQRLAALLTVPETGNYRFWIAGDDICELWLSTDADRANRRRIARTAWATWFREWSSQPTQMSGALPLVAGRTYYLEALHKEGVWGDHLSVAWEGPSFSRRILDGCHLAYPGTPPAPVALKREVWTGIGGNFVGDLAGQPEFPASPAQTSDLESFSAPERWGDNYGQKISGFLIAPRTGGYRFWIASDDGSELRFSPSGIPGEAIRIAFTNHATGRWNWTNHADQASPVVHLMAGQRCYIEALHKEGIGDDYLDIAWEGPGFGLRVLDKAFLEYPGLGPGQNIPAGTGVPTSEDPGFAFWVDFHALQNDERLPGADPDRDGIPNLLEFVLGGDPTGAPSSPGVLLPGLKIEGDDAVFEFRRSELSLPIDPFVEMSADLLEWERAVDGRNGVRIEVQKDGYAPGVDRVSVRVPLDVSVRFLRLRASPDR